MTHSNSTSEERTARSRRSADFGVGAMRESGELLAALCRSEALAADLDDDQFGDLVHARGHLLLQAQQQRQGAAAERRRRVLAHDDLAKRLKNLLGLADARNWNCYVPPQVDGYGCLNTSRVRTKLIAICREAHERETNDRSAWA